MSTRIGVFVCHCGTNIGGTVNVPEVVRYAGTLPNVVWAEGNLYTCSDDGLSSIREKIKEHDLNRVVVASCTPRTHEPLFRKNCELAGLNKYLFEFINLREHCSWVHKGRPDDATGKARDLVRMGAAKASLLTAEQDQSSDVTPTALVVGAGISGLSAAMTLARQGYQVELIEKRSRLGGLLRDVNVVFPSNHPTSKLLEPLVAAVDKHENVRIRTRSEVADVKGFIGNFTVTIRSGRKTESLKIGTIIVAVGAEELKPAGLFGYQRFSNVLTQLEFERQYRLNYNEIRRVVMINCAGARIDDRTYCGRFCCITAMKNAVLLKTAHPDSQIAILQRDIMACGNVFEEYYQKALQLGIKFIRYNAERPPEVIGSKKSARKVRVDNELTGRVVELGVDAVVLTTPLVPASDNPSLSRMLKVPIGSEGFFLEAHQKLRPVEFPADGIFIAGCARYPTEISECIAQGHAAAAKAAIPMSQGRIVSEAYTSEVNPLKCSSCGRCLHVCPFGAVDWVDFRNPSGQLVKIAGVNSTECKGCGLCVASCISGAIQMKGFNDEQILAMVNAIVENHETVF